MRYIEQGFLLVNSININTFNETTEIRILLLKEIVKTFWLLSNWSNRNDLKVPTLLVTVGSSNDSGSKSVRRVFISSSLKRTLVALVHCWKWKWKQLWKIPYRPKLCGNCTFPQNFHTRELGEVTVNNYIKKKTLGCVL